MGFNVAKALTRLGHQVNFLTIVGNDLGGEMVLRALENDQISPEFVRCSIANTAQSIILYDSEGRRQINVDLKNVQEQQYPMGEFFKALHTCSLAVLCNVNFSRPLLTATQNAGVPIATDVHAVASIDDSYDRDFMAFADILILSDERLSAPPEDTARQIFATYPCQILAIGLGSKGILLAVREDNFIERIPAVYVRPVVNTIGAGDALFSAFLHEYVSSGDPYLAARKAVLYAGYKIGEKGAAEGLLDRDGLERLYQEFIQPP